ncbi:MAG: pseudouridine synthase [Pseudomonadota bacterium]
MSGSKSPWRGKGAGANAGPKTAAKSARGAANKPERARDGSQRSKHRNATGARSGSAAPHDQSATNTPASAAESAATAATDKLQKVLANFGLGSRRTMEGWIEAGRVKVNGERAHLGQRVGPEDRIQVDNGKPLKLRRDHTRVLLLNKSVGTVCSRSDPEQRSTVFQGLPRLKQGRWISVGRLDIQTSGLLLLTNNGTLAHRLMHPSTGLDREYAVRVTGKLDDATLDQLLAGVEIDGELHRFSDIQYFDGRGVNHWYHVVLMEGKNREVRRLFESVGLLVSRLKRVRYGPVILPPWLPVGQRAELEPEDVLELLKLVRLEDDLAAPVPGSRSKRRRVIEPRGTARRRRTVLTAYPDLDLEES